MEKNKKNKLYYIITIVMILFTFFFGFLSGSCSKRDNIKNNYQPTLLNVQESLKPDKKEAFVNEQYLFNIGRQNFLVPLYNIINVDNNVDLSIYLFSYVSIGLKINYNVDNTFNHFNFSVIAINMINRFKLVDNITSSSSWFDLKTNQFGSFNSSVDFSYTIDITSDSAPDYISFNLYKSRGSIFTLPDLYFSNFNFNNQFTNNTFNFSRDNVIFRSALDSLHEHIYNAFYDSNVIDTSLYFDTEYYFNVLQFRDLYFTAYSNGFEEGLTITGDGEYNAGYQDGYKKGETLGYELGFKDGYEDRRDSVEDTEDRVNTIWSIFERAIQSVLNVLQFDLLPGIPLYVIIVVPVLFALLIWFIKLSQS